MDLQHLKDKEWDISLTRNYCIMVSMHIISSIHIFTLKIPQILGSHPFMTRPTQKLLNQLLAFMNLYQHAKNQSIQSVHFLRYTQF